MTEFRLTLDREKLELNPETINGFARELVQLLAESDHKDEGVREMVRIWSAIIYLYASDMNTVQL